MTNELIFKAVKEHILNFFDFFSLHNCHDIIVFSPIRWDYISQRPQYIVTKLAKRNKILFIEEPIPFDSITQRDNSTFRPHKNITVLQPQVTAEHSKQELPLLIAKQIREQRIKNPILLFYTPSFRYLVPMINHSLVVYDYSEQHTVDNPVNAEYLLNVADIVFCSEKGYFEKKKNISPNLYYLSNFSVYSEDIEVRLQRIMQAVIAAKRQPTLYTKPLYHPFFSHISATSKRLY